MRFVDARNMLPRHPTKRWRLRDVTRLLGACIHHTAGGDDPAATARYHIGPNHTAPQGMPGLAYTFYVRQNGDVYWANDLDAQTWSQGGKNGHPDVDGDGDVDAADGEGEANARFVGIVLGGNFDGPYNDTGREPTGPQILGLLALIGHLTGEVEDPRFPDQLFNAVPFGMGDVYAHADFGKPACPGATVTALVHALQKGRRVAEGAARVAAAHTDAQWQRALVLKGYDLGAFGTDNDGVDGEWGTKSRAALIKFQKDHGITPSGHRDAVTAAALFGGN